MSNQKYLTAIICCNGSGNVGSEFKKYRNIKETDNSIASFLLFAAKFPGVQYVNFYYRKEKGEVKGKFKERIYLQ